MLNLVSRGPIEIGDAPTDAALVLRWTTDAEPGALEALVRRHGNMVFGVCRRVLGNSPDADDAFQATFLLLVRKAHSLARPEQVAGWLHAVALRVARKARAVRARRRVREVPVVDLAAPIPPEDGRELREVLDEELDRLPEKYRLPIVLCELEGRTLDEAAQLLGWPKGTVAGRLSLGREMLRQRLSRRRGLILPLFVIGGVAPSDPLVHATLRTATSGASSASWPVQLAESALRKGRWWLVILLLLVASGGLGAAVWHASVASGTGLTPTSDAPGPVVPPGSGGAGGLSGSGSRIGGSHSGTS
jgi:RNA polymerase sigma factor (sigma-70 family)